ncbi:MAG TPA: hypothetical protein VNG13_12760 [Mycobacteriales bacterium]|nr:hypothetical protein [Mycobacteriales bacterium]
MALSVASAPFRLKPLSLVGTALAVAGTLLIARFVVALGWAAAVLAVGLWPRFYAELAKPNILARLSRHRGGISHRLGLGLPSFQSNVVICSGAVARSVGRIRPVYLDGAATALLGSTLNTEPVGLLSVMTSEGHPTVTALSSVTATLTAAERSAQLTSRLWDRWPSTVVRDEYAFAELALAKAYDDAGDKPDVVAHLRAVLRIQPSNSTALRILSQLGAG